MESFEPYLSRIENLTTGDLEECTQGIPTKWCEPDPGQLARLIEALYARRRTLRQAIIDAKNSSLDSVSQLGVRRKESGVEKSEFRSKDASIPTPVSLTSENSHGG